MSVIIRRIGEAEYRLDSADGSEIRTFHQETMTHPDDWLQDARDAGYSVHGPYDWEFVDTRNLDQS